MYVLALVGGCILLGSFGQVMMKAGMSGLEPITGIRGLLSVDTLLAILGNRYVVAGIASYVVAAVLWLGVLSVSSLSAVYPLLSLNYALVAVLSTVMLGEDLSLQRWGGIALVMVGCALVLGER